MNMRTDNPALAPETRQHLFPSTVNFLLVLIIALQISSGLAQNRLPFSGPTIPTYHWVYPYLEELQLRHPEMGFDRSRLPLSVTELDTMLQALRIAEIASGKPMTSGEHFWLERIDAYRQSFRRFNALQAGGLFTGKVGQLNGLPLSGAPFSGLPFTGQPSEDPPVNGVPLDNEEFRPRLSLRSHLAFMPRDDILLFNTINLDQELEDDPNYLGKKWRGFAGYTEQAYVMWRYDRSWVKFGRDFVVWSRGRDASLLLSDYARPLDQIAFSFAVGRVNFSYVAAKLDDVTLSDSLRLVLGGRSAQRYLAAQRVSFELWRNKLQLAVSQAVLYGGPGQSFELSYFNPFIFLHGESLNTPTPANSFGSIDMVFRPQPGLEFYGQLLIDDIQIERTGPGDLEPSEMGYLVGGQVADPFGLAATSVGTEYTRITNRTYNTAMEFEKFLHRRRPIAHFLGNDFDRWLLFGSSYFGRSVWLKWDVELRRRGEGRIEAPWDQPWANYEVSEGYSEKFPTGTVEKGFLAGAEVRWHPRQQWFLSLHMQHSRYDNFQNQNGVEENLTEIYVRGWLEFDKFFRLE